MTVTILEKEESYDKKSLYVVKLGGISDYNWAKRTLEDIEKRMVEASVISEEDAQNFWTVLSDAKEKQETYISDFYTSLLEYNTAALSSNLEYLMNKHSIRVSELETILGLSAGYISRTVNPDSKKRLSIDVVWRLSNLFKINVDDLLNRDLAAPSKDIQPVVDFIEKLKKETDEAIIHWKSLGSKRNDTTALLFKQSEKTGDFYYSPEGCEAGETGFLRDGTIYSVDINIGKIFLVPTTDFLDTDGYDILVEEYENYPYEHTFMSAICCSTEDSTGTLNVKCEELMKAIKAHAGDYVITSRARANIDGYLNPRTNNDDEMPFN